jgi:HlyD family type I secretion membrane fusion protein
MKVGDMTRAQPATIDEADWRMTMPVDSAPVARAGMRWVGFGLAIFVLWGLLFPLASSVVSTGMVTPRGQAKLIQHPYGGVVSEIVAKDGDYLKKGELIARIEPAQANADLAGLLAQRSLLKAQEWRLRSLKAQNSDFNLSDAYTVGQLRETQSGLKNVAMDFGNEFADLRQEQEDEYLASSNRIAKEISALEKQLEGHGLELRSLNTRLLRNQERVLILLDKITRIQPLAEEGYIAKSVLWDAETQLAEFEGQSSQLEGQIDKSSALAAETRDRIAALRSSSREEFAKERSAILAELAGIEKQIRAAELSVAYTELRAPANGTLAKLQIGTIGGVVEAGGAIAELIPDDAILEVETRILPVDIGEVAKGQEVELVITSLSNRLHDPVMGRVSYVAANSSIDERTGDAYFLVRIEPDAESLLSDTVRRMTVGMQADVYIKTGSRNFFSWLLAPVMDSVRRAFNEA